MSIAVWTALKPGRLQIFVQKNAWLLNLRSWMHPEGGILLLFTQVCPKFKSNPHQMLFWFLIIGQYLQGVNTRDETAAPAPWNKLIESESGKENFPKNGSPAENTGSSYDPGTNATGAVHCSCHLLPLSCDKVDDDGCDENLWWWL